MGLATHHRVLVSSRGDGNWVAPANALTAVVTRVYFPPGTGAAAPTSTQDFTNNINFSGWSSKSNWMVQARASGPAGFSGTVQIYAGRPGADANGLATIEETLLAAPVALAVGAPSLTHGGLDTERIAGPISYFRFDLTASANTPTVECYVTGWNEGDLIT